jgi:Tol biopolymer transport system component/tRNA A-37 threonylcarbamoyl transferase component Bud32
MSLNAGSRLGPYEIETLIGSGGMGEVYRARDTRLDRRVAIKVLLPEVAADPERRERFEREARTVAGLNHSHICVLHDIGHDAPSTGSAPATTFLVMEELAGETLADRLHAGPLPLQQALRYGMQILDALDAAHRQGIVHRDLKPGNVFLVARDATTSSQRERRRGSGEFVKLLDFGLAKAQTSAFVPAGLSQAVTGNASLTAQGTILGTIQYMAPEQLEGRDVDARTDLFAFGSLLYEMVTGRRAFEGKSQVSLMAAILDSDPKRVSEIQPLSPPALDHVIQGCLAKSPDDRWQTARDVMKELQWIAAGGMDVAAASLAPTKSGRARWLWAAASFVIGLALASVGAALYMRAPEDTRQTRFSISTPEIAPGGLAMSPDGRYIAMSARTSPTVFSIYLRSMDAVGLRLLPGTEGGAGMFWSADSQHLGFVADNKLKRIDISGGPPQTICTLGTSGFTGGAWNSDGVVVFGTFPGPLKRVPAQGGEPVDLTDLRDGEVAHAVPVFLPDGRHVLYAAVTTVQSTQGLPAATMVVGSLDSKERAPIGFKGLSNFNYVQPGYLLFHRDRVLFAQPFDAKRLTLEGEPRRILDELAVDTLGAFADFSASSSALVYHTAAGTGQSQLVWYDRTGKRLGPVGDPGDYHGVALSPDNKRVAVHVHDQTTGGDIWVRDFESGAFSRFTTDRGHHQVPMWSPDGSAIAFASDRDDGVFRIYQKSSSGVGSEEVVFKSQDLTFPEDYSPDGKFMSIAHSSNGAVIDVEVLPLTGERKPQPFTSNTEFAEGMSKFSPDNHWIAYESDESRRLEVYVQQFPGRTRKVPVSTAGGRYPRWSRSGKELFYMTDDGSIMAVDVRQDADNIHTSPPRVLFKTNAALTNHYGSHYEYDVSSDGQRFIVNERIGTPSQTPQLTVVLNWSAGLKR